ncbi:MAG: DUF1232 domain-containing protein [Acidimicrobiia bacterium]|nr:DUF1232 domain-containing protein [Acidimicrobiia bacterium]
MIRDWLEEKVADERTRDLIREAVMLVPNLGKLAARLAADPRVPVRAKAFAGIAAVYAFSPIDVVPDFIPLLGKTDDILLMALALRHVIEEAGVAVVREHWDGPDQVLTVMIDLIGAITDTVPRPLRMALNRFLRAG